MKQKKIISMLLAMTVSLSLLAGCSNNAASDSQQSTGSSASESSTVKDDNAVAAKQLLKDLTGSYQELWPVILDSQYEQLWPTVRLWWARKTPRRHLTSFLPWSPELSTARRL